MKTIAGIESGDSFYYEVMEVWNRIAALQQSYDQKYSQLWDEGFITSNEENDIVEDWLFNALSAIDSVATHFATKGDSLRGMGGESFDPWVD